MGAYLATPPLPWAYNQGGSIILRDKYVTMQDVINGAVVFEVKDNQGNVSNATIVQYPSDQQYYLQASGTMLWKLGDISQSVNKITVIATGNIPQGFSIVGVTVQDLPEPTGILKTIYIDADFVIGAQMTNGEYYVVSINGQVPILQENGDFDFRPTPYQGSNFSALDSFPDSQVGSQYKVIEAQYDETGGMVKINFGNIESTEIAVIGDTSPTHIPV